MPRLSLYKPEKGKDYKFLDKVILEMFTIGGTDLFVHKYIGTDDGETVKDETQIQDLVFMENRDRKYDADIYTLRGIYNVQDIDFDLSQFGLFLSNDTLFMTIHINSSVETIGRKIMPGDVLELPHLRDEYAANDYKTALKRFYVVEDVNRASEGFSPTWYPHLYRIKLKQIVDSQEFADILNRPENEDLFEGEYESELIPPKLYKAGQVVRYKGILYEALVNSEGNLPTNTNFFKLYEENTLRTLLSTYEKEMAISDSVVAEANANTNSKFPFDVMNSPNYRGDYSVGVYDPNLDPPKLYKTDQVVEYEGIFYKVLKNNQGVLPTNTEFFKLNDNIYYPGDIARYNGNVYEVLESAGNGGTSTIPTNINFWKLLVPVGKSGYDVDSVFYTLAVDEKGKAALKTADSTTVDAATTLGADAVYENPVKHGYQGYLIGDDFAPNGSNFGSGITFPPNGAEGDYFMRTDFMPRRLFRYDGRRWVKVHDVKRTSLSTSNPDTLRGSFINNINTFIYENKIATDFVRLTQGQTIIDTDIAFVEIPYIQLSYENPTQDGAFTLDFVVADYANLISNFIYTSLINDFNIGQTCTIQTLGNTNWNIVTNDDNVVYNVGDSVTIVNKGTGTGTATQSRIRVTLPSAITTAGVYTLNLYNSRQNQRQALSQVLRPKADN